MNLAANQLESRWPFRGAVVLVGATFVLLYVGGLVTTTDAGMAFKDWLTSDGHFMLTYPWLQSAGEKFLEHGHRLMGATVGFITIGVLVLLMRLESRKWVRIYGWLMLAAVIAQGVLGGMRIVFDERTLAMIHGCTGPLFFTMTVGLAVVTSRSWRNTEQRIVAPRTADPLFDRGRSHAAANRLAWFAVAATAASYLQLVAGAWLRHLPATASAETFRRAVYTHLTLAAVVSLTSIILAIVARRTAFDWKWVTRPATFLAVLLGGQLLLGLATWVTKFGMPRWLAGWFGDYTFVAEAGGTLPTILVTTHMAVGSLILVTAATTLFRSQRLAEVLAADSSATKLTSPPLSRTPPTLSTFRSGLDASPAAVPKASAASSAGAISTGAISGGGSEAHSS